MLLQTNIWFCTAEFVVDLIIHLCVQKHEPYMNIGSTLISWVAATTLKFVAKQGTSFFWYFVFEREFKTYLFLILKTTKKCEKNSKMVFCTVEPVESDIFAK